MCSVEPIKSASALVLTTLLCCWLAAAQATALHEHPISLVQFTALDDADYQWQMDVQLSSNEYTFLLNTSSVTRSLTVRDENGQALRGARSGTAYEGVVADVAGSWVRIHIDRSNLSGVMQIHGDYYELLGDDSGDSSLLRQLDALALSRSLGAPAPLPTSGSDTIVFPPGSRTSSSRQTLDVPLSDDFFYGQGTPARRVAHLGVVIDSSYDEAIAGRGLVHAISTINAIDGLYRERLGIALSLDSAILMTDPATDPLKLDNLSTADMLLEFRNFRRQSDLLGDDLGLVHFFTGNLSTDGNIGLAFVGSACRSDGYDVSLSLPSAFTEMLVAHEIAHNLGALHDDDTSCADRTDQIMYSEISNLTTSFFSSCSLESIREQLSTANCHSDAIDVQVTVEPNEDDSLTASVINADSTRAIPGAELAVELTNATLTYFPPECVEENPRRVLCQTGALSAGSAAENSFAFAQADPSLPSQLQATVEPIGVTDLVSSNNSLSMQIAAAQPQEPADDVPATEPGQPLDDPAGDPGVVVVVAGADVDDSGGGGSGGSGAAFLELLLLMIYPAVRWLPRRKRPAA